MIFEKTLICLIFGPDFIRTILNSIKLSISFDTIRIGKRYYLKNFGERFEFEAEERKTGDNFILKDIHTLERYELYDLVKYGRGKDFEIYELE